MMRNSTIESPGTFLVDIKELAERTTLSDRKLMQLARDGKIPSVVIGKRRVFDPADVVQALKKGAAA